MSVTGEVKVFLVLGIVILISICILILRRNLINACIVRKHFHRRVILLLICRLIVGRNHFNAQSVKTFSLKGILDQINASFMGKNFHRRVVLINI